jgi:hypothetical protein
MGSSKKVIHTDPANGYKFAAYTDQGGIFYFSTKADAERMGNLLCRERYVVYSISRDGKNDHPIGRAKRRVTPTSVEIPRRWLAKGAAIAAHTHSALSSRA